MIQTGEQAPGFTLPGIENGDRHDFSLSDFAGRNVVLAFYPGDNTPGCTRQLCSYRDDWSELEQLGAVLLGISPQSVDSHEKFATKHNFPFPLLADTDKSVIDAYGVGAPIIGVRRSVFVVDGGGAVRYTDRKLIGATFVPVDKLVPVLSALA
jgi:peroxiredoxin Q/BCP